MNGKCANACAPSTIVSMPRARASSQISLDREDLAGQVRDVAEVQHLRRRRDRRASSRSARSSIDFGGTGNEIFLSTIPSRRSRWCQVSSMRR